MKRIKQIFLAIGCVLLTPQLFASQVNVPQLQEAAQTFLDFFTSTPVKVFFAIALSAMAVGFITNRDNEAAKKKFVFWGLGIALILSASQITDMFFTEGVIIG